MLERLRIPFVEAAAAAIAVSGLLVVLLTPVAVEAQNSCGTCGTTACQGAGGCVGFDMWVQVGSYTCPGGRSCALLQQCKRQDQYHTCPWWSDMYNTCGPDGGCPQ